MIRRLVSFAAGAALVAAGFMAGVAAAEKANGIVRWAQSDLKWEAVPNSPVSVAKAWTHANGSYCQFNKFPKGMKIPLHFHTADLGSVVVAGRVGFGEGGRAAQFVGPGTYQSLPGGLKHTTECGAEADCVVFTCGAAPFDLVDAAPMK
jgi:quercetin dioxygenase-like cupin family protein